MNPEVVEAVARAVRGGGCLRDVSAVVAEALRGAWGVEVVEDGFCVRDPVAAALWLVSRGVSEGAVAGFLDWRMFEEYAARAFDEAGFTVYRGLRRYGRGGFQVDVLALDGYGRGVVVECKHWSPRHSNPSRLRVAAERHVERTRRLAGAWDKLGLPRPGRGRVRLLPALLVLRSTGLPRLLAGVPVISVSRLKGFIEALDALIYSGEVVVMEA